MNNYEMLYQNALLADAAYIDFSQYNISGGVLDKNNGPLRKEFLDRGFTDQQIDDFFVRYEIKHYQPNNSSGFSATAFVDKKVEPNKITVSFRGTEPPNLEDTSSFGNFFADLKQDLLLAKGVSELNPFSQDNYIEAFLYELEVIDGSGSVLSGYEQGINIVGHSLGGYLAAMAAVDNPELIDQVYTYNGAGLTGLDLVYNGFVKPHLLGKNLDQSRFHNFYAEPGYEITAGQAGSDYLSRFWRPGSRTPLFIEGQGDVGIANHSMIHLVNALSVGRLLAYLDETKTIEFVDNLLWQASNKAVELRHDNGITQGAVSLDSTVRNLSTLLGGGFLAYSTTNDAADFYLALKASNAEFRLLSSEDVISLAASFSGEDTQQTPETRAVMYALLEGIPFSLVPLNGYADGIFSDTTDNEKYDASRYSEAFIRDKSDHLSYLMARNKADIDSDFDARESTNLNAEDTFYLDLSRRQNDLSVGGTVIGNPSDDTRNIIFGTDGVDDTTNGAFDGSKNNDRLYGMGGDDKLFGRKGDDYLEGGKGNDTFYFSAEDGYDRIGDTQFEEGDKIVLNVGGNGFDIASYSFSQSSDETSYVGTLNNNNSAPVLSLLLNGTGLLITARDSSGSIINNIEVDNFSDGDFGLSLASANESDDVSQGGNFLEIGSGEDLIIGEQEYPFFTAASYLHQDVRGQAGLGFHYNASDYYSDEVLFEYSQDPSKFEWVGKYYIRPTRGYHFYGSINKDRLIGGNQSDALFGGGEDDRLEGRGGHDTLFGGSGSDQIIGGSGNDVLFGAYTPDYVLDKDSNIVDVVDVPSSVQDPVARDEISGGDGSDLISGSHSVDIISGGGDADMIGGGLGGDDIYGGAGNDRIFGDSVFANRRIDGSDRSIIVDGYHPVHHVLIEGLISHQANPDELSTDDVIDGGTGNDVIWGEKGKDIINGGEGTDFIFGDRNNTPDFRGTTYDELNDLNQLSDFVRSYFDVTQTDGFYQHNFAVNLTQFEDISQWHDDDIINGGAGSDYIEGNGGSDTIHGNDGDDQIRGDDDTLDLAQHKGDTLHGDAGVDTIWGNGGNDKIHGGSESDWLYGGEHDDEIKGGTGNDLIYGDANDEDNEHQGADTLIGNSGDDLIYGEGGNDTLIGGVGNDVLNGGEGNDSYLFSVGDGVDALSDSDGQSTLVFHAVGLHDLSIINSDYLYIVYGDGDVIAIDAGSANAIDSIEVGGSHYTVSEVISELALSNESWSLSYSGGFNTQSRQVTQIVSGNIGGSEFVESFSSDLTGNVSAYGFTTTSLDQNEHAIESGVGHANIIGIQGSVTNSSAQFYIGDERDNIIVGDFNRRNIIDGGTGNDTLWGGQLSDIYYVDSENDVITGEFTNQFYGANTDKVVSTADRYTLGDQLEVLELDGDIALFGGGNDLDNIFLLDYGHEGVTFDGGLGDDFYVVNASTQIVEDADGGHDTLVVRASSYTLGEYVEDGKIQAANAILVGNNLSNTLWAYGSDISSKMPRWNWGFELGRAYTDPVAEPILIEAVDDLVNWQVSKSAGSTLVGGAGDDRLFGAELNDTLDGGTGNDTLSGGAGNDTYIYRVGGGDDVISWSHAENGGTNYTNTVQFEDSVRLDDLSFERDSNKVTDLLINVASGGSVRVDNYFLAAGSARTNTIDKVLVKNENGDSVVLEDQDIRASAGALVAQKDTFQATKNTSLVISASDILANDGGESGGDLALTSVYANYGGSVTFDSQNNTITFTPDDSYTGSALIWYEVSDGTYTDSAQIFIDVVNATSTITGDDAVNELHGSDNVDDTIDGLSGDDHLYGHSGSDTLIGGDGHDLLDGGEGDDMLEGGAGDDRYYIDSAGDSIQELAGAGEDHVFSVVDYTLGSHLENLTLQSGLAENGMGNSLDNEIHGNSSDNNLYGFDGNDSLYGGDGSDRLEGGLGNDLIHTGNGNDVVVIAENGGHDVIDVSAGGVNGVALFDALTSDRLSFYQDGNDLLITVDDGSAQSIRVQNHFLDGESAIDWVQASGSGQLTTEQIDQLVAGNNPDPAPDPGPGDFDTIVTGTGEGEQLLGTNGDDLINALGGNDTLYGFTGNDFLAGGDGDDRLQGGNGSNVNSGDDLLIGGEGNDILVGEDGNDTLDGGSGSDHYYYYAGAGQDVLRDSGDGQDILFFVDVSPDRLSYHQDSNDLIVLVDGDLAQQVRVENHFLGGDNEIMVQPNGGFTQTATAIATQLTALPGDGDSGGGDTTVSDPTLGDGGGENSAGATLDLSGDDDQVGTEGRDFIVAGAGADTLSGLGGNDRLVGGAGNDVYVIGSANGKDTVVDTDGQNTLRFVDGIGFNDVASGLMKSGNDLILNIGGNTNQVKINNFFSLANTIDTLEFESGGQLSAAQLFGAFGLSAPTATAVASDLVLGDGTANSAEGSANADIIMTGRGDDTLSGLAGDDQLIGGADNDTYIIGSSNGKDTVIDTAGTNIIRFVDGIGFNDVASGLQKSGGDLVLNIGSGNQVRVESFFDLANTIDKLEFESGGQITAAQLYGAFGLSAPTATAETWDLLGDVITGGAANDTLDGSARDDRLSGGGGDDMLSGAAGDDVLSGGVGNDTLNGGSGNDRYLFGLGDGQDHIVESNSSAATDILTLGDEVSLEELWFSRATDDLQINIAGTDDQVTIDNWYTDANAQLDEIELGNSVLLNSKVEQLVIAMASYNVPSGVGNVISQGAQEALQPILTEAWQARA